MSRRHKWWIWTAAGLVLIQSGASLLVPQGFALTAISDLTQLLLLLSGTLALVPRASATHGRMRLFWALMAMGIGFWLCYQAFWVYFEVLKRTEMPNPFGGDVVLFLHFVPMIAALALQPHLEQDDRTARLGTLDFTLLLIWWLYLYLFAVIPWQYVHVREAFYDRNLNTLYLTEKTAFLVGVALLWLRSRGRWKVIYANWFGAGLSYGASSFLANWAIARKVYHTGSLYDVPLAMSMAWVTWVGLFAREAPAEPPPVSHNHAHGVWVARLGMIAIFSLPSFAAYSAFDTSIPVEVRNFRLLVTLATMLVMGFLVFLKQHLLDRELLKLLGASRQAIENLKRLQAQLVQSEKLASLGQLVGGAAHELNNPLTAMMGYFDMLAATQLSHEQRVLTQKIQHQVRRTRTLVSSLLSFAKQVPGEKSLLDVNALIRTAVNLCQPQLRSPNVQVKTDLSSGLPRILGDSNQLLQVCMHITNNAVHAMSSQGGILNASSRARDGYVILEFSDDGPGIDEPERVFDPFYTTRPVGQGSGLGLSVCYGIIQEHDGKIFCENRPEGGARFRIELPVPHTSSPASHLPADDYAPVAHQTR